MKFGYDVGTHPDFAKETVSLYGEDDAARESRGRGTPRDAIEHGRIVSRRVDDDAAALAPERIGREQHPGRLG